MLFGQISFIDSPGMAALFESYRAEGIGVYWRIVQHIGLGFDPRRDGQRPAQTLTAKRWGQICGCSARRFIEVAALASRLSLISLTPAGPMQHGLRSSGSGTSTPSSGTYAPSSETGLQMYEVNAPILLEMLGGAQKKTPKNPIKMKMKMKIEDEYEDGEKHKESAAKAADKKVAPEPPADAEAPAPTEQFPVAVETPEPPAKNAGGESVST